MTSAGVDNGLGSHLTGQGNVVVHGPLTHDTTGTAILPAASYTGQAEFDLEQQAVFASGWVWAGFTHWVAESGQVKPITVAGRPLLLVRDTAGELRVFHNSCRHRGMALTEDEIQVEQRIQCAYHCWSYHLDGRLAAAPYFTRERRSRLDPELAARLGLLPVAATTWAGMVFVNLAAAGGTDLTGTDHDFAALLAPLIRRWAHIDLTRISLAEERAYDIPANWKLVVENFLDFYHLPFIHPQVGPVSASLDVDDVVLADGIVGGCYPRGASGKADKTDDALPFLGDVPADRVQSQDIFCVFPNALLFLEADWFQVIGFEPLAPDRTLEHMAVFVDATAGGEEFGPSRKRLAEVLFEVNEQDLPILAKLQAGRHSPGSDATNLVSHWDQVTALFQSIVARRVSGGPR